MNLEQLNLYSTIVLATLAPVVLIAIVVFGLLA